MHVDAVSLRADRSEVAPGVPFHARLHVHIQEPDVDVAAMAYLPDVSGAQIIADERQTAVTPAGSDFTEDITLQADKPGVVVLTNAHVDAIDPKSGKPFRYAAPTVRIRVVGPSADDRFQSRLRQLALVLGAWVGGIALVALLLILSLRRIAERPRKPRPVPPPPPPVQFVQPAPPALAPLERVRHATDVLAHAPTRGNAVRLRTELFSVAGVSAGGTLRDALSHVHDPDLGRALVASERAAFAPDADLAHAIGEVVDATRRVADGAR